MTRPLPSHPCLEHLRKEAKALLKAHASGDRSVCVLLRNLRRFESATDQAILTAQIALHDVQFALAIEYGFANWEKLKADLISLAMRNPLPQPDARGVDLAGWPGADSFSITMQAAGKLCGTDADYETIYALSTNGFAPDICPGEDCKSTWRMLGRGRCMDLVAAYLGLDALPITFEIPPRPAADGTGRFWGTPAANRWIRQQLQACAAEVRKALEDGAVVVTDGGWVHHWEMWGIVCEAREDGTIVGMAQFGPPDNTMDHARSYWALRPASAALPQDQADRAMLEHAVHRIRGDRGPFSPGPIVFGLAAMDQWIAQMGKPEFQEDSPDSSAGNARLCAMYTGDGAKVVANYLRRRLDTFPGPVRRHLQQVAECYDRIADLLSPFSIWEVGKGYRAGEGTANPFMRDFSRREAHVGQVLRPVKNELAAAADEIERALVAMA